MAINIQRKITIPNPLSRFSFLRATKNEMALKINVRNIPVTIRIIKFQISDDRKMPKTKKGIPNPNSRLDDKETASPMYCPRKMLVSLIG